MADNPLVHVPTAWPVLQEANALRRRVVGRVRSVDMLRWPDVPYGAPHISRRAHIWELNDLCPRDGWPVVLLLHGGGWVEGSWRDLEAVAPMLARRGMMAVGLDYRLGPDHRWPAQLDDVLAALDWVDGLQIDPTRVALWGHSAGGHLALLAALHRPEQVRCVVTTGAPTDLERLARDGGEQLDLVFDDAQLEGALSARLRCDRPPPMMLLHGTADPRVDVAHAREMKAAFPEAVELVEVRRGDHGVRWPPVEAWRARRRAQDWLVDQLAPPRRGSKWRRKGREKR